MFNKPLAIASIVVGLILKSIPQINRYAIGDVEWYQNQGNPLIQHPLQSAMAWIATGLIIFGIYVLVVRTPRPKPVYVGMIVGTVAVMAIAVGVAPLALSSSGYGPLLTLVVGLILALFLPAVFLIGASLYGLGRAGKK